MCAVGVDRTDSKVHIATMTPALLLFNRQYWSLLSHVDFVQHIPCVDYTSPKCSDILEGRMNSATVMKLTPALVSYTQFVFSLYVG